MTSKKTDVLCNRDILTEILSFKKILHLTILCMKLNEKSVKEISLAQQVLVIKYWGLWVGFEVVWTIKKKSSLFTTNNKL